MTFGKSYTEYWASAVNRSVDGTVIAGVKEAKYLLDYLGIQKSKITLDLGCSYGRMYELFADYSSELYGIDIDRYAVEKARLQPYREVRQGSVERTGFTESFFDTVFCWAVFDVVDHEKGLIEINRILRTGGKFVFSGKNNNYFLDDNLAYKAEKNAFLKGFPNKFTDLNLVLINFKKFGFELDKLLIFPRRGDLGLLKFIDLNHEFEDQYFGYDYLILCHKISEPYDISLGSLSLCGSFSKTAIVRAAQLGFSSPKEYFESIGID
jgi:SAM-dependent methyltransferase